MPMLKVPVLTPKQDFILVRTDPVEAVDMTEGGIHLADDSKPQVVKRTGEVVAVGPDAKLVAVGERILFAAYAGTEVEVGGEVLDLMRDGAALAGL